ncbi:unnamed protein product [Symbiodinium natans]|uniref:Uncharacterized protein n=1 Tax=Symbiodinium natans TaxID=878477 RepID=A0A812JZD0_9DINO|nr:unnamed protein product [Symbiodinium natans]
MIQTRPKRIKRRGSVSPRHRSPDHGGLSLETTSPLSDAASSHQMPAAFGQKSVDEARAREVAARMGLSPSSSRTSSPSPPLPGSSRFRVDELEMRRGPIDTASKKKPKKKKSKAPGFDVTKHPGEEKSTMLDFMQRLKHATRGENTLEKMGVCFHTVQVKEGPLCFNQSTVTVTAEDRNGVPHVWSGQEFRGEVAQKKLAAEHAACRAFFADAAVQETAANMEPAYDYKRKLSEKQKQRMPLWKEIRRAKRRAAAAAERKRRPCICRHGTLFGTAVSSCLQKVLV